MFYFKAGGGKRFSCNIKVAFDKTAYEKAFTGRKAGLFHQKSVIRRKKKPKNRTGVVYEGVLKKKGNRWGGGRERESSGFFCWIQNAQRRRWRPKRKSIIRSFASCYTQC